MQKQYLTAKEVSEMTGISENRLAKLRCYKQGPRFAKIGKSVRYQKADVESWLEAQKVETTDV